MKTNELGFAAFLILQGCILREYKEHYFHFESGERSENEWRVEWIKSDMAKFDKLLLDLKRFKN